MGTEQVAAERRGTTATTIDSADRAVRLAEHLLDAKRTRPVVVVTQAAGQLAPHIQVDEIINAVRELAEVYLLATGSITFAPSDRLPEPTQVYGGAGRAYPVDRRWQSDPYAAPLCFAFGAPGQWSSSRVGLAGACSHCGEPGEVSGRKAIDEVSPLPAAHG